MLTFVGLGLYDELDISLRGLEAVKTADVVFAEFYTSVLVGTTIEKLEQLYGKKVNLLSREEIEEGFESLLTLAMEK
ncbi:MAG: diphthine synthase, partial [Thermoplasmata archaeon]